MSVASCPEKSNRGPTGKICGVIQSLEIVSLQWTGILNLNANASKKVHLIPNFSFISTWERSLGSVSWQMSWTIFIPAFVHVLIREGSFASAIHLFVQRGSCRMAVSVVGWKL